MVIITVPPEITRDVAISTGCSAPIGWMNW
jgi:hypothetical protein